MTRTVRSIAALGAAFALFAACGGSSEDSAETTTTAPPTTTVAPAPALDADAVRAVLGEGDPETEALLAGLSDDDIECIVTEAGLDPDGLDAEAMLDEEVTTALGLAILTCAPTQVATAMAAEMGIEVEQAECLLDADGVFMQLLLDSGDPESDMSDEEGMQMLADLFQAMANCGIDMGDLDGGALGDLGEGDSSFEPASDEELQALYDSCATGELADCDQLYLSAPFGSDFEEFGSTCGGTTDPMYGGCTGDFGMDIDLDALAADCEAGDMDACDTLYFSSEYGSDLEAIADTCGGTREAGSGGICAAG